MKLYRLQYARLGIPQAIISETHEPIQEMMGVLFANQVWFDVDFPEAKNLFSFVSTNYSFKTHRIDVKGAVCTCTLIPKTSN